MKRVLTAVVLVPIVLLIVFRAPFWLFTACVATVALLATMEYFNIVDAYGFGSQRILVYIILVLSFLNLGTLPYVAEKQHATWVAYYFGVLPLFLAPWLILFAAMAKQNIKHALPSAGLSYLAIPYLVLTMGRLPQLRGTVPDGGIAVLYLLLVVWSGDVFAYYVGRVIGKTPLAPSVSPKKSWEGAIASFIASLLLGTIFLMRNVEVQHHLSGIVAPVAWSSSGGSITPNKLLYAMLATACINVAAQAGDLIESMMKRGAGIKDSGSILPGHGGLLDRIDALLLASPVLWYYANSRIIHF